MTITLSQFFGGLAWVWLGSEVLAVVLTHTRRGSGEVRDRGTLFILWPVIYAAIWFGMAYGQTHPHTMALWARYVGFGVFSVGLILRWSSMLTLGKSFSVNVAIHASQTVKQNGLYRFVRHPSYSAMLLLFVGLGLEKRNWISLAIIVIPSMVALLYRIHVEERALMEAFGEEYAAYARRTKRLIPAVY